MIQHTIKVIENLLEKGIIISVKDDSLNIKAKRGVITNDILKNIEANKYSIISLLKKKQAPLSFAQERLWFIDKYNHNTSYNMPWAVSLFGEFDIEVLENTLLGIVSRHEVLRTNFVTINDEPKQLIHENPTCRLEVVNLSHLSKDAADKQILVCIGEESRKTFDLANDSLVRFILYMINEKEAVLFMNQHHIISDGWSFSVFFQEVSILYKCIRENTPSPLAELPIQYADYAIWQRSYLEGERLQRQAAYWKGKLEGVAILELPTDKPRPKEQTFNGKRLPLHLNKALTDKLKQLSKDHDATLFMTLLSVFKILLHRYTGQSDICVGSPIANRTREEIEGLIGFFVNTLALRSDVATDLPFNKFLKNVRATTLEAYENQDIPFEKVVDIIKPERNLTYSSLFQVMMALQNSPVGELSIGELSLKSLEFEQTVSKFDLILEFLETTEGLVGRIEYNTDLFDKERIERMIGHFEVLVSSIVSNPTASISDLEILTPEERHQLLVEWNDTEVDYPREKCIHQLFEDQVAKTPSNVAVVFGNSQLTYTELNEKSNQLAHYLQGRGVKPETLVGICVERSLEMIIGLLGILKSGGAYVPIDPAYPEDRISYMLEDAGCGIVLTQEHIGLVQSGTEVIYLDSDWDHIGNGPTSNVISGVKSDNLAYVIYTSGSTGKPKGSLIEHGNVISLFCDKGFQFDFSEKDVWSLFHSYCFDFSVWEMYGALLFGGKLVIIPKEITKDPERFCDLIEKHKITVLNQTPSAFYNLSDYVHRRVVNLSLRYVVFGGEELAPSKLKFWYDNYPACRLINMYGITETTVHVTYKEISEFEISNNISNIGKPISTLSTYVLDKNKKLLPIGLPGELCVSGAGVCRGYLKNDRLTKEKFQDNPFVQGEKIYLSGDSAYLNEFGELIYCGRIDDQVKIRGFRIELGEIESVLNKQEEVSKSLVIAEEVSDSNRQLIAYVVPDEKKAKLTYCLQEIARRGNASEKIYILPNGMPIVHINRQETEFLYSEIYDKCCYLKHGIELSEGDCIIDIGANIGMFSILISQIMPSAKIYSFEPIPDIFDTLRLNASLYSDNINVYNYGVGAEIGNEIFSYYPNVSILSGVKNNIDKKEVSDTVRDYLNKVNELEPSYTLDPDDLSLLLNERLITKEFECSIITISEIIKKQNLQKIDLLKIDAEKSEVDILKGVSDEDWGKIQQVVVEIHDTDNQVDWVYELLTKKGFRIEIDRDEILDDTRLYNLFATRLRSKYINYKSAIQKLETEPAYYNPSKLKQYLKEQLSKILPDYMVPSMFVYLDKLPVTSNGKVDKKALPAPEVKAGDDYIAPSGELEDTLVGIWSDILGIDKNEISINQSFFEIGGNSLLTIKLQQKLSQLDEFKLITIPELFKYHTIRMLAQSTRQGDQTEYKLHRKVQIDNREIAIIGMSGAFSGVNNLAEFWQLIKSGSEGVRFYSKEESNKLGGDVTAFEDPDYIPATGHVKDIDLFDPLFWDVSPNEAKLLDPQIRKFIEHCWFALESSGYIQQRKELNIGVFAGSGSSYYFYNNILNGEMASEINIWEASNSNSKDALATKTSYMLGLSGPANSINTACSTGLVSVVEACKSLQLGTCDMVLAGGVSLELPYQIGYTYQEGMISSKDGHCRTFDEDASGTVGGSGVGAVLLKRLEDAIKDNDNIIGVIKGYATNNDGARKTSYTAPSVTGQAECIINAQKMAGVSSGEVAYVECHGTATNLGDPIEVQALREAFEFNSPKGFKPKGKTVLGAVKANIGHTNSAAGTAGLLKACLMLQNNMIPGQPNFSTPNPKLNIDQTNFEVSRANREWFPIQGKQRIAGVSSFGIGGTNAHVIIGDYIPDNNSKLGNTATNSPLKEEHREALNYVIPIAAKSKESLGLYEQQLINYLTTVDKNLLRIEDIAYTLQEKREHFNYRRAYCASDVDELMQELDQNASIGYVSTDFKNRIVFMFPGQGSQYPGMAKELYDNEPYFKTTIDELISRANVYLDIDLHDVIFSEEGRVKYDINETRWAQIVLFIIEYAFAEYIEYLGIHADAYTGHSLGEYVAATLSGVFTLEDAVKVVIARGKLMQSMQEGSMLAINAKEETICTIVDVHKCEIAAMNSIEDIVVSGNDIAINALKADLEEQSISSVILNTSHAYHSRMMEGAAIEFEKLLSGIKLSKPGKIFISNLTGEKAGDEVMSASYWSQQLRNTVQFSKGIDNLANHFNYRINFIEVGPGKGLGSFVTKYKNINNKKTIQALHLLPSIKENAQTIKKLKNKEDILAKLWVSGIVDKPNDLKLFKRASALPDLPTYQFNFKKCWLEPSKGNDLNGQLKILPKEKWLSTPIWTPVSNLNRTSTKEGVYKKALVFIRKDQLNTFDFTFLAKEIHFIVLYTKKPETEDVGNSKFLFANMKSEHDFNKIAELLKNNNIKYDLIIHASSVDNETQLENALSYSFYSLFLIRQYLLSVNHLKKLLVLTNGLAQITNEDIIDPLNGTLVGAIRNINHEYPNIDARAIDIGRDKNDIEPFISQVVNDGLYEKSEELLAIRFGKLWKESFERIDNSFSEYNLIEENDVILITGGLGGIALSVAKYISNRHKVTFLLVSRHNILNDENPTDYIKQKIGIIDEIRSNGSFVDVYSPDISDAKQVIRLKEQIENKYGHIHGIIHTAEVSPLTIDKYNLANVRNAFKGKVYGVYNIIKNINLSKVKYVVSTSSLASIMGDVNRIEYCASNSYLDYLSIDRIGFKNIKTLSINWPGWSDIGMIRESSINIGEQKGQLKGLQKFLHLNSVTQSDGAEIFYHLINQCNYDQVILSKLNIHDLKNKLWGKEQAFPQDIQLIVNDGSFTATEFKIAQIWSQVLGIKEIGLHDNFFELGGHSLSATQVVSKIKTEFNVEPSLKVLFELPILSEVADYIDVVRKNKSVDLLIQVNKKKLYEI